MTTPEMRALVAKTRYEISNAAEVCETDAELELFYTLLAQGLLNELAQWGWDEFHRFNV